MKKTREDKKMKRRAKDFKISKHKKSTLECLLNKIKIVKLK